MTVRSGEIHVTEFNCTHLLKCLEHCKKCVREGKCSNRGKMLSILTNKKKLVYKRKQVERR